MSEWINNWIWDNLFLAIILNILLALVFVVVVGNLIYKLVTKKHITKKEWWATGVCIFFGFVVFLAAGLNNSPIHL